MMKRLRQYRAGNGSQRGSALIMTTVVIAGLMVMGMATLQVSLSSSREISTSVDDQRALFAAEAGIAESVAALSVGGTGGVGAMKTPAALGESLFWVEATDQGDGTIILESTALAGRGRVAIEVVVSSSNEGEPLFAHALNSDEPLHFSSGSMVDSYDSSLGSYASQAINVTDGFTHAESNGQIASNSDIKLAGDGHVFGDATPGPSSTVDVGAQGYVSGSTLPALAPMIFPPIAFPPVPSAGNYTVPNNGSKTLPSGQYGFDQLTIGKGGVLTVEGPADLVLIGFEGGMDARLMIDATNGPVTVYTDTYSHLKNFEAFPVAGSPMAVAFMIDQASDLKFPNGAQIRGAYYAPNARVHFPSSGEVWGAISGRELHFAAKTMYHYDEVLSEHWTKPKDAGAGDVELLSWRKTAIDPSLLASRGNPFDSLGVTHKDVLHPADAWDMGEEQ